MLKLCVSTSLWMPISICASCPFDSIQAAYLAENLKVFTQLPEALYLLENHMGLLYGQTPFQPVLVFYLPVLN